MKKTSNNYFRLFPCVLACAGSKKTLLADTQRHEIFSIPNHFMPLIERLNTLSLDETLSLATNEEARSINQIIDFFLRNELGFYCDNPESFPPLNNFWEYQLYIILFPKLIAGPIIRYHEIADQINGRFAEDSTENKIQGFYRFCIGLAKKVLLANVLAVKADEIFNLNVTELSTPMAWIGMLAYTFQIYFDFSGYSDMAIGIGKMLGFTFPENFNNPYTSGSFTEFWRRWHISLSTFFRDYVYIPLGGNRKGPFRVYLNLLIVFFLTGLWHGASWNYIIWGLFHGSFLLVERLGFSTFLNKIPRFARHLYTLFVVMIGWVFFRLENLHQALDVLKKLFFINTQSSGIYTLKLYLRPDIIVALVLGIILSFPIQKFGKNILPVNTSNVYKRILLDCFYIFVFLMSLSILSASTYNPFIYFRF